MEAEVVLASSPTDAGVSCWDLHTGAEHLRYKSCASSPHGLASVAGRFLASSQLRDRKSSSGSILYWSWNKPQVEVRSFPAEPIKALVSNSQGTYIAGGGVSGDIYFWEVATGKLLKKWHAHYRAVSCLEEEARHLFEYSFHEHSLRVTDVKTGYGGSNAIIVSASEDRTCKVWSLSRGKLLRNIVFPSIVDAISLDPGEHVFYACSRDGPVNNVLVIRQPQNLNPRTSANSPVSPLRRHGLTLPPPLEKFANSPDENAHAKVFIGPQTTSNHLLDSSYISVQTMEAQIKELQQQGSSAAAEVDIERLKSEQLRSVQMIQQWKKMYENLHQFCVTELLDGTH
ncbi:hypothetical protein DH2020_004069 [Rehmannia glutinosa]|uniref:Protein ROOT INITIATION DEFECTIVE 3 n=1 Tax=Rehmannia glutinosa TaxID=99300 RepID=A0ABR0XNI5_REHGL